VLSKEEVESVSGKGGEAEKGKENKGREAVKRRNKLGERKGNGTR
jgi:hypothetical protein